MNLIHSVLRAREHGAQFSVNNNIQRFTLVGIAQITLFAYSMELPSDLNKRLIEAVNAGNKEEIEVLVKMGADATANQEGFKPLYVAAWKGDKTSTQLLLDYGATLNAATPTGSTALHIAAHFGHRDEVELLLQGFLILLLLILLLAQIVLQGGQSRLRFLIGHEWRGAAKHILETAKQ